MTRLVVSPVGRAVSIVLLFGVASIASVVVAVAVGSVALSATDLLHALPAALSGSPVDLHSTLLKLRLDRALLAWVTGSSLALAGVMMQALLRNPLADPYVLGISGGASVGALLAMLLSAAVWQIDLAALLGAVTVTVLLLGLVRGDLRSANGQTPVLLLTGVILSAGCGALVTLMLSIAPDNQIRSMIFWLVGDVSATELRLMPWLVLAAAWAFCWRQARALNILAMYGDLASTMGVAVNRLRLFLFLWAAALTASAVTNAGSIGFLGLIVPHACRFALGPDHRLLLPVAALSGGMILVLADTLARTIVAPQQLPVGVITALIGVPVFLLQLQQLRRRGHT